MSLNNPTSIEICDSPEYEYPKSNHTIYTFGVSHDSTGYTQHYPVTIAYRIREATSIKPESFFTRIFRRLLSDPKNN